MPIYDYVCSSCSTRTEFIHGIDAPTPRFCPACGAEDTLRKVFAAPTVHFKGSGWAKKDRSSSSSKTKAAAATGSGDGSSGSTTSSEGGGSSAGDGGGSSAGDGASGRSKDAPESGSAKSTSASKSGEG